MAINEFTPWSGLTAIGESVFLAIIACAIAVKIAELIAGDSDTRFFYGLILIPISIAINILFLLGFFTLSPLSLNLLGVDLFEYLASSVYREIMVVISVIIQFIFTLGITFSKNY